MTSFVHITLSKEKPRYGGKLFFLWGIDVCVANVLVLYLHTLLNPVLDQLEFCLHFAQHLISDFSSRKRTGRLSNEQRILGKHFSKGKSQKCTVCVWTYKTKKMKRPRNSVYWRNDCQPPVPPVPLCQPMQPDLAHRKAILKGTTIAAF